jgi:DNA-directed RNA polymerase
LRNVYVKPFYVPSLREPQPWTEFNNPDREPFLRHTRLSVADLEAAVCGNGQMRPHMEAVSYLQATPCAINELVFQFVRRGSLVDLQRRADRRVFDYDMADADLVRGKAFYIDMNCDHRGRVNALPYFHYGRGDHIRALFRFAHGEPITKRGIWWLKVATCNCYDEDGASRRPFEERVAWTEKNLDRIHQIAADPWSGVRLHGEGRCLTEEGRPWLAEAKDPHQFLAHAIELARSRLDPGFITTLPIAFDASNSGAQHYALLMRDRRLAELTNLIDSDEPKDLYSACGDRINRHFLARLDQIGRGDDIDAGDRRERDRIRWCMWQELHTRKAQKGFAVAWIYGSGERGQRRTLARQIREKIRVPEFQTGHQELDYFGEPTLTRKVVYKWLPKDEVPKDTIKWFIEKQREAMEETAPCIGRAIQFIKSQPMPLRWVSPSGVGVRNFERKSEVSTLTLWLGSKDSRNKVAIGYEPEIDVDETRRAAPPNFVHSMDAAHLAFVALACEREGVPLLTVHDSFATLPRYADRLQKILLHELRKMYTDRDWLAELDPSRPPPGDLRIEDVRGRYAFG